MSHEKGRRNESHKTASNQQDNEDIIKMESPPTDTLYTSETKQTDPAASSTYTAEDEAYMRLALQVAERALQLGEVPVGCVIVLDNPDESPSESVVVSHGANQVNATRDATRHAEMVAIDRLLTKGRSSDALRLPASVLTQSARSDMLPTDSPLLPANQAKLQACWDDQWVNVPAEAKGGTEHWKNSYGWGTGRVLSKEELSRCRLYVSNHI